MKNYYNEWEPKAAAALRQLIKDKLIPDGEVDTRSIADVRPEDLKGFTQVHLFAGIGGWPLAFRLAGWPDERPVWSGSYPCQPFSSAGKQKGGADERHLWPIGFELKRKCRPAIFYGEQVASAISHGWLDRVFSDMEGESYACGAAVLPACAVGAPHKRDRLWYVAHSIGELLDRSGNAGQERRSEYSDRRRVVADTDRHLSCEERLQRGRELMRSGENERAGDVGYAESQRPGWRQDDKNQGGGQYAPSDSGQGNFWDDHDCILCADGKARRIPSTQSGICLLAHGIPERVGLLRAGGNAIVPEVAARFIRATM